jgi:hypothetical protein
MEIVTYKKEGTIIVNVQQDVHPIEGSGTLNSMTQAIDQFNRVVSNSPLDVRFICSEAPKVEITADHNLIKLITFSIDDDTLFLHCPTSFSTHNPISITIFTRNINYVELNSCGSLDIDDLKTEELTLVLNGDGNIFANGEVEAVHATLRGQGDINCASILAKRVHAISDGVGEIEVSCTDMMNATIMQSGSIQYYGKPAETIINKEGSGRVFTTRDLYAC